jgi:serine/threonine protein kinase
MEQCVHYEHRYQKNYAIHGKFSKLNFFKLKDQQETKKSQGITTIEDKVESWKIEYKFVTLGQKIAEGRFGEVYQGTLWGKTVAIKRLKSKLTEKIVEKLKEEAAVMSSLRHPNITLFMGICTNPPNVNFSFFSLTGFYCHGVY